MSTLFEQASLVMIPSGYKEDVVYSVKPTDGSGDLTFTRASDGTRVNSQGLVERVPWNLFGNSESATSGWGNPYQIASVTANSTTAPNGTNTGNLIVENNVNSTHWFEQSFSAIAGTPYTISVYFKAKERTQCSLYAFTDNFVFSGQLVIFNLSTGAVVTQSGTQTNSIENVGNGWYRCAMTVTANASATAYFGYGLADGGSQSYQGDGTSGLYMWGRQLNTGTLKPYFPTTDRLNVPRLDYSNGCPSLLLEPQRTNEVQYSQELDNAYWLKYQCSITANQAISPDGTQNADLLSVTHSGDAVVYRTGQTTRAMSFYAKALNLDGAKFYMSVDGVGSAQWNDDGSLYSTTGTTSTKSENVGNGWFRFTGVFASGSVLNFGVQNATTSTTIYIWGIQNEAGTYPTSYIPTTSASVTRVADTASKTGISSLFGSEFSMFADVNLLPDPGPTRILIAKGTGGTYENFVSIERYLNTQFIFVVTNSSGTTVLAIAGGTATDNQRYKFGIRCKNGDFAFYINGTQIGTRSTAYTPSVSTLDLHYFDYYGNNSYNQVAIFPTALTNAELASLTTL